jgi:RNA exonuclease 4
MVEGESGKSILARVTLVNSHGNVVYDKLVLPTEKVTDYRTWVTGLRKHNLSEDTGEFLFPFFSKLS